MVFWSIALSQPDCDGSLTREEAFEFGRAAWKADAGSRQLQDFAEMTAGVPKAVRMAALNGWLCAFDTRLGITP
jgi:hypothetical protein